ncbi:hypothetical protein BG004_007689, partial [Podila humilis]
MDPSALEEESLAIVSIYGPSSFYPFPHQPASLSSRSLPVYTLKVSLEEPDFDYDPSTSATTTNNNNSNTSSSQKELELRLYFPEGYPETNTSAPVHEIVSIYYGTLRLSSAMIREIDQGLEECFVPGEVVVFAWIEWLRSYLEQLEEGTIQHGHDHDQDDEDVPDNNNNEEEEEEDEAEEEVGEGDSIEESSSKMLSDYFHQDDTASASTVGSITSSLMGSLSLSSSSSYSSSSYNVSSSPKLSLTTPGVAVFKIQSGAPIVDRKS